MVEDRIRRVGTAGGLRPFSESVSSNVASFEPIHQGSNQAIVRLAISKTSGKPVHRGIIGFASFWHKVIPLEVAEHWAKNVSHVGIGLVVLAKVSPSKQSHKGSSGQDVLLDRSGLEALALDGVSSTEVEGVHRELELAPDGNTRGAPLEEEVVVPLHIVAVPKVVQPAGTNRPNTVGRTQGTGVCLEYSLKVRSCSRSGLGMK